MDATSGKPRGQQGFASMDAERRREIGARAGKAVAAENRSFSRNRELAREAGRKGGKATKAENRIFSKNPELARAAGAKGGKARQGKRASAPPERAP